MVAPHNTRTRTSSRFCGITACVVSLALATVPAVATAASVDGPAAGAANTDGASAKAPASKAAPAGEKSGGPAATTAGAGGPVSGAPAGGSSTTSPDSTPNPTSTLTPTSTGTSDTGSSAASGTPKAGGADASQDASAKKGASAAGDSAQPTAPAGDPPKESTSATAAGADNAPTADIRPTARRGAGVALLVAGAVVTGGSIAALTFMGLSLSRGAELTAEGQAMVGDNPNSVAAGDLQGVLDEGRAANRMAAIMGAAGGALLGTGIALIVEGSSVLRSRHRVAPTLSPSTAGVVWSVRF